METRNCWRYGQLYFFEMLYGSHLLSNLLHQVIGVARKEKGKGQVSHRLTESSAAPVYELMEKMSPFSNLKAMWKWHTWYLLIFALTGQMWAGAKLPHSKCCWGRPVLQALRAGKAPGCLWKQWGGRGAVMLYGELQEATARGRKTALLEGTQSRWRVSESG